MNLRRALGAGARWGAALALAYAAVFIVFAMVRYARDVWSAPPDGGVLQLVGAGAVSLAVAALGIALLMAVAAAGIGAATGGMAAGLAHAWRSYSSQGTGRMAALLVAGAVVAVLHIAVWRTGSWSWASLTSPTYLFWLGIPSLIYLAAAAFTSRMLRPTAT